MIQLTLPDGKVLEVEKSLTGLDIAKKISNSLPKKALAIKINEEVYDLSRPIENDAHIAILTWENLEGKQTYWHSTAHLMAEALEKIYGAVKFGIGPPIKNGFYYDIDLNGKTIKEEDLVTIEKEMQQLASQSNRYERENVSKADAISYFMKKKDPYKLELLEGLDDGNITFYTQGNFTDLCRGPHIPHTGMIKNIKLLNTAGAYWRGNEKNKQLTRIYGISFPKAEELRQYIERLEAAKKRDHRKIGTQLELFAFSESVGSGLPLWLPRGAFIRQTLIDYLQKKQVEAGYNLVSTPHIGGKKLYETSGHFQKYGSDSFQPIETPVDDEVYLLKPMNCPHHCKIFEHKPKSYRDLPYRIAEFGTVYRYEQSGELHGLARVRGFTQDDAHIFCTSEQVRNEFCNVIDLTTEVFKELGFETFETQISLRDKTDKTKYIGNEEAWEKAETDIIESVASRKLKAKIEYGEAAFYGPKLDFIVEDSLERKWQLGTIQVDYNLPDRFELSYVSQKNRKEKPVMIHRAPFGSLERFMAILIEHNEGHFPLWLCPTQVSVLTINQKCNEFGKKIVGYLKNSDIRTHFDHRDEKINKKIKEAEILKIPYKIILGEKEMKSETISVRHKNKTRFGVKIQDFIKEIT